MEASEQGKRPAWLPSTLDADALREKLQRLKDKAPGGSPAEVAASVRGNLQGLKERGLGGSSTAPAVGSGDAAGATVQTPPFEERPELYVGAAFAGGLAVAGILRLLGR